MLDGRIDESAISGYAVYAVNWCGEREGDALATVTALGIQKGTQQCCNDEMYKANVLAKLPEGVMSQSFMVVPLTSIGALDVGWVTYAIADFTDGKMPTPAVANSAPMKETSITQEVVEVVQESTTKKAPLESKVEAKTVLTTSAAPPSKKVAASVAARNAAASAVVLIIAIFEIAISS